MLDALKLMRIPFSIYLMPVFWFAITQVDNLRIIEVILIFVILHIFVYPTSNGYNCYFDKDEGSIGGLKSPPKVNRYLFPMVLLFDATAVLLSCHLSIGFAVCIFIYIMVSKAYSWDKIRLKKYPILSTLVVTVFQGFFIFISVQYGIQSDLQLWFSESNLLLAASSSLFLLGSYPLTQVYQHAEDSRRGDRTLSILLGIRGTFIFSSIAFLFGSMLLGFVFLQQNNVNHFYFFLALGGPILGYFGYWFNLILKDEGEANFEHTMRMNKISSICLSAAFALMLIF